MPTHYIVTPVRNAARTIDTTIWSIVSQAGQVDVRYHVQDGGSTDGTLEKLQAWASRIGQASALLPGKIDFSFASEPDRGMYEAITKGFDHLAIPPDAFMSWCNADDALWPGALDAVARLSTDLPDVDWITGWLSLFDDFSRCTGIVRSPHYPQAILASGLADGIHSPFVQQESVFWRKRLWDKVGGLNASLRLAGDWDLWVRFARHAPLTHVDRQLGAFYVRPGQQSSDMKSYRMEMEQIFPHKIRSAELRSGKRNGRPLMTIPCAVEGDGMRWQLKTQSCSPLAAIAASVLERLPVTSIFATKVFYKLW